MTKDEMIETLKKSDAIAKEIGLPPCDGLAFVIVTPRPPQGDKVRTAFGLCKIMNCQQVDGGFQTVFRATRKQIEKLISKLEKETP